MRASWCPEVGIAYRNLWDHKRKGGKKEQETRGKRN